MEDFNQTRSFNLGIAQATSVDAALIFDSFSYLQGRNEGKWFYHTYDQLIKFLPVMSESTARRAIKQLLDGNWIEKKITKVNGTPTAHYRLTKSVSVKMTVSETVKMTESKETVKMTESIKGITTINNENDKLLLDLLLIVNPREKPTAYRRRLLHARLQDYSAAEICDAAKEFSKSEWHRDNGQMSIDNLLAPSKFGRWFAQIGQQHGPQSTAV